VKQACVCVCVDVWKRESCNLFWPWMWFCVCLHPQVTSGTTQHIMCRCILSHTTITALSSSQQLHTHFKEVWHPLK